MMDFEKIKENIFALYDECLETHTPFHRKLDLFIVPNAIIERVLSHRISRHDKTNKITLDSICEDD